MWTQATRGNYSRKTTRDQGDLANEEWGLIEPYLPGAARAQAAPQASRPLPGRGRCGRGTPPRVAPCRNPSVVASPRSIDRPVRGPYLAGTNTPSPETARQTPVKKVYENAKAALDGLLHDNIMIMSGGFGLCGVPITLIKEIRESGVKGLTVVSNNAGIDGDGLGLLLETRQIG